MKKLDITLKEYENGKFNRVEKFPIFRKVFPFYKISKNPFKSKKIQDIESFKKIIRITEDNKTLFTEKIGRWNFIFRGEYNNYGWCFEMPSGRLIIFTGKRGTSYEYEGTGPTKDDAEVLKSLFDLIINKFE